MARFQPSHSLQLRFRNRLKDTLGIEQLFVGARLYNSSGVNNTNAVGIDHRTQPVGNHHPCRIQVL
jgi:hypothetical protein